MKAVANRGQLQEERFGRENSASEDARQAVISLVRAIMDAQQG